MLAETFFKDTVLFTFINNDASVFFLYRKKENIKLYCIKKNTLKYYKLQINQKFEQTISVLIFILN